MFEIPPDLNPALAGLAWLRGRWEGTGYREWPGEGKTEFGVQIDFVENGVAAGLPDRESWRAAFGLTVSLVWIYTNLLRILAIIRND